MINFAIQHIRYSSIKCLFYAGKVPKKLRINPLVMHLFVNKYYQVQNCKHAGQQEFLLNWLFLKPSLVWDDRTGVAVTESMIRVIIQI